MNDRFYQEPARKLPVYGDFDVIVVGGGCAGLAASLSAARLGAKTLIIEQFPYFGGTATASLMCNLVGTRNQVKPDDLQVMRGIGEEFILDLYNMGAAVKTASHYNSPERGNTKGDLSYTYAFDPERFKWLSLKKVKESGCEILFHTWLAGSIVEDGKITGVVIENKSGRQAVYGKVIVDASGDGDVAFHAGAPFWQTKSDEAKRLNDGLMYRISGFPEGATGKGCAYEDTMILWGPVPGAHNGADGRELTDMEINTRLRVYEHLEEMKKEFPAFKDAKIIDTGALIGVRQTRFIEGEYKITGEDVLTGAKFDDSIAMGANPVISYYGYRRFLEHQGYEIPYRCLVPLKIDNLLVAGRCISSDQIAYESWRAMATIFPIGEAAGTAAALAVRSSKTPRALDVGALQTQLIRQGAEIGQNAPDPIHSV